MQSIRNPNFGQDKRLVFTLGAREACLNITSGKIINFGLPKSLDFVPKFIILREAKNDGLAEEMRLFCKFEVSVDLLSRFNQLLATSSLPVPAHGRPDDG